MKYKIHKLKNSILDKIDNIKEYLRDCFRQNKIYSLYRKFIKVKSKIYNSILDEIVNIKEYLEDCFQQTKIYDLYRKFIRGIHNFYLYKNLIWEDRWWDSIFILKMLKRKLELMEYNFRVNGHYIGVRKDARKIKICVLLLDRIIKDDYYDNVYKNHYKKWGKPVYRHVDIEGGLCRLEIDHANVKTKEDEEQEKKEFRILCDRESKMKQQDIDYLFKLISKHILSWWD